MEERRPGVFEVTVTAHELSVRLAAARMSLSLMETDRQGTSARARSALETVLGDFDSALARVRKAGGRLSTRSSP